MLTHSTMTALGQTAPDFDLPGTKGRRKLADFQDQPVLVVAFICNHCPYVHHVLDEFSKIVMKYQIKGVGFAVINSNDSLNYPEDNYEQMKILAKKRALPFNYLYDELQTVAKAYHAACTPDFFVFNQNRELIYRGQMDNSRPNNGQPINGADLRFAIETALANKELKIIQKPSSGCSIKWKAGNEPQYFQGK